ncbi:MAG: HAD-IC family P-type ATPase, partial [Thermomicrobiales bacterium]
MSTIPMMPTRQEPQPPSDFDKPEKRVATTRSLWDLEIVVPALKDAVLKLDPRRMARNPVMFVVEVGSVITTFVFVREIVGDAGDLSLLFLGQLTAWLWFTVLFANFAEAMAEGRGKAQASTLRKTRTETMARRVLSDGRIEMVPGAELRPGDIVRIDANELIPNDGEVIDGVAFVSEAAITGESAPVLKEPGTDIRSSVTGGTLVVSDTLTISITAEPGSSFLDRMIALVEGSVRQKTPNEIALTILLAGMTIIFMLVVISLRPFAIYSGAPVSVAVLIALLVTL